MMEQELQTPFESIEGAQEYIRLLGEEVIRVLEDVEADRAAVTAGEGGRRLEALHLVCYKLQMLQQHIKSSSRILNDLCLLRRLFDADLKKPLTSMRSAE